MLAVILAGGDNRRFPSPKGLIKVCGQSIIERQIKMFRSLDLSPAISTNSPETYGGFDVPLIGDCVRKAGPMTGIVSAFIATGEDEIFFTACDMPFIRPEMIEYIISHRGAEATVPFPGGTPEPLIAVYTKSASDKMLKRIELDKASMRDMLDLLDIKSIGDDELKQVDPEGESFININTLDDYNKSFGPPEDLQTKH